MPIDPHHVIASVCCALCIAATGAAAQEAPASAGLQQGAARVPAKGKKVAHVHKPDLGNASSSSNLNAPAMDFSHAEPEIDDPSTPRERGQRSNVHPSIDSNGRPAMGLGF